MINNSYTSKDGISIVSKYSKSYRHHIGCLNTYLEFSQIYFSYFYILLVFYNMEKKCLN